jgi:hypothetical protein
VFWLKFGPFLVNRLGLFYGQVEPGRGTGIFSRFFKGKLIAGWLVAALKVGKRKTVGHFPVCERVIEPPVCLLQLCK